MPVFAPQPARRRPFFAGLGFNPRRRYLRGLGCCGRPGMGDDSLAPYQPITETYDPTGAGATDVGIVELQAPIVQALNQTGPDQTSMWTNPQIGVTPSGQPVVFPGPSSAQAPIAAAQAASPVSWFSQKSALGVSNGVLAGGLGLLALLAMGSSGRRRR